MSLAFHFEHRAVCFGRPLGPWRDDRKEAWKDAELAGEASRTRYPNGSESIAYLHAGTDIISRLKE